VTEHARDGAAQDQPALDLRTWQLQNSDGVFALRPLAGHQAPRPLRGTALGQMLTKLGAPTEFLRDRLPAELQLATVNYLMASQERPWGAQLRLRNDEVTAVVSERYTALDPVPFVDTLRLALREHGLLSDVRVLVPSADGSASSASAAASAAAPGAAPAAASAAAPSPPRKQKYSTMVPDRQRSRSP
jgi:hypothetical protein